MRVKLITNTALLTSTNGLGLFPNIVLCVILIAGVTQVGAKLNTYIDTVAITIVDRLTTDLADYH